MIEVYQAQNMVDAQLLCDQMLSENIPAVVKGGYLSGAAGELPVGSLISIWIERRGDLQRAREVVKAYEQRLQAPSHPRICSACNESSHSNFSHCWNCQAPLNE